MSSQWMHSPWVALARNAALVFCAAVAAYVINISIVARPAYWLAQHTSAVLPQWALLPLGITLIDFGKLVGLLPAAWFLKRTTVAKPLVLAIALVAATFALELAVMALVQQSYWLWTSPTLWLARLGAASLLIWPTACVLTPRS